jgi:hypothetical protein
MWDDALTRSLGRATASPEGGLTHHWAFGRAASPAAAQRTGRAGPMVSGPLLENEVRRQVGALGLGSRFGLPALRTGFEGRARSRRLARGTTIRLARADNGLGAAGPGFGR